MTTTPPTDARYYLFAAMPDTFTAAQKNDLLDRHAAEVRAAALHEAADDLEARCPKHGNGETTFADCLCAAAHELRRMAAAARPDNTGA